MRTLEIQLLSLRYRTLRIVDPVRRSRIASSIAQHGQLTPVVVHADEPHPVLIDGYVRVQALSDLGRDLVVALELPVSGAEALVLGHRLGRRSRRSALEEAWLLRVLIDDFGLKPRELARRLERSPSWISRRLGLIDVLPESVQQAVRDGRLSPQAAMKSLVPLARANREACTQLVDRLADAPVSVRDLDRLVRSWRRADDSVRARILEHPRLYLRAAQEVEHGDPKPIAHAARLLDRMTTDAARCRDRLDDGLRSELDARELDRLDDAWNRLCHAFAALTARMDHLHARSGHTDRDSPPRS